MVALETHITTFGHGATFERIVDLTYCISNKLEIPINNNWELALAKEVRSIREEYNTSYLVEASDLSQQLALMWLKFFEDFLEHKPRVSLKTYLIRRSIWGIRDWLTAESRRLQKKPQVFIIDQQEFSFNLDLTFLLNGTDDSPLSTLSAYERYLIFLKFKEEKNILQMSYILQCDCKTTRKDLDATLLKLKELSNNKENIDVRTTESNGPC